MDFKSRLNSCGRFSTDENFKKIIMRNSCRLRQNSAFSQKEIHNNKEPNNDINNIKIIRKYSNMKNNLKIIDIDKKKSNENFESVILYKKISKKDKKCFGNISDKTDNNSNEQSTSSNILFFYQDIRALKLYKNNKIENNTLNNIEISFNNKYNTSIKKRKIKNNSIDNKKDKEDKEDKDEDILKSNTLYNDSIKKRKHFLLKRMKHGLDSNLITNEIKLKKNLFGKQKNETFLNNSVYINNKNNMKEKYSTEINNTNKKINHYINHHITKENLKLYKKPQNFYHHRNINNHNSVSLFPVDTSQNEKNDNNNTNDKYLIKNNSNLYNELETSEDFISYFFCELIDLSSGMEEKSLFDILTNNLNKKYIYNYKSKSFPKSNTEFIYCFKHFCALITPLLFLSKDNDLYKYDSVKGRLLINQYIYSSLCFVGKINSDIPKINNFLKKYTGSKKVHIKNSTSSFIKLIFGEKPEYEPLKSALIQLIKNISNESVDNIINILNNTILFCFNNKPKEKLYYPFYRRKSQRNIEENSKISESSPSAPFIKSTMKKEFCLVLDIDETISHSMKLSFGYYFLLRPGTIDFLKELSNYYEIDIFTSSLKLYADFIIDKIDTNGDLISYRLYKHHVTYEKGKSVKNLNMIGRDLNKIIFVDNLKSNAKYNLKNLCHISSWTNDIYDNELIKLKNKLKYIATSGKYNDDITKGIN